MKTILTGIQPSGKIHLGNFLGAIQPQLSLASNNQSYFFIANLHALTANLDHQQFRADILNLAIDYLALGLKPSDTTHLFLQSEISEHTMLSWILATLTPTGLLDRAHAWKDAKTKKLKNPTVGLYTYPILMSADILLYNADLVPVGKDQKQHIEIARDLASKFNQAYQPIFKLPEPYLPKSNAVIPGTDGQKMSKSYKNTLNIFDTEDDLKRSIMSIKTDSLPVEAVKNPDSCPLFQIYATIATPQAIQNMKDKYLAGGLKYSEAKLELYQRFLEFFQEAREKKIALSNKIDYITDVLSEGNKQASTQAKAMLEKVKSAIGLNI